MIRAAAVLVALALVAGLVLLLLLVLRGEDATVPRDRGEMTLTEFLRDGEIAAVPRGPGGPAATEPGAREEVPPPAGTEEPGPSAAARAAGGRPERLVLRVGWVGTRPPEADPRRLEAALPPPPVPRHPQAPPLVREIHVAGARPLSLQVRAGPPWGEREFQPLEAGAETTFRLEDPHGGRGPRILRFLLDKEGASWVERFLQEGAGAAHFEIGAPGEITGRITDAAGKPLPGVAEADGVRAQADFNGDFTLQGVRAGVAVVRVHGPVANHAVTRCLLRAPGGPYTIALEPGFDLKLRLEGVAPLEESARPFWACLVPAGGSTAPETFAAETAYHRESRAGAFTFHRLPRSFRGVTVVFHPDHAARFVPIAGPADREVRVLLEPRALVTGLVRDAGTGQPVEAEVLVATSADETTLHELAAARHGIPAPRDPWRQPVPYLGQKLVEIDLEPASGKTFEIRADPGLERIAIRVEAAGYLPAVKTDVLLGGVRDVNFQLREDPPIRRATVELELPAAPPGGWRGLVVEGTGADSARVFPGRGLVRIEKLFPGLYWFNLEGVESVRPIQVEIAAGANVRLRFE